jgi:hypothetical protein
VWPWPPFLEKKKDGSEFVRLSVRISADIDSIPAGHVEMNQKCIHGMGTCQFHCGSGGFGFDDLIAFTAQRFVYQFSGIRIFIDNQNATVLQTTSCSVFEPTLTGVTRNSAMVPGLAIASTSIPATMRRDATGQEKSE